MLSLSNVRYSTFEIKYEAVHTITTYVKTFSYEHSSYSDSDIRIQSNRQLFHDSGGLD
jgi:hypothetical protein